MGNTNLGFDEAGKPCVDLVQCKRFLDHVCNMKGGRTKVSSFFWHIRSP
jgi:hypothetical protein